MASIRTLILPTDGADPSALLANLFSKTAGTPPTLVDGDGEILAFIIADPSTSTERAYDARPIPAGTTAKLALGNALTGVIYAEQDAFTPLPAAAAQINPIQVGSATQPAIVEITLNPAPYGGTWTVDGLALAWNATETAFGALFPAFTIQKTGTFTWRMTGTANGAYTPTVGVTNLLVPTGLQFVLDLSTATALALAFGQAQNEQITVQLTMRVTFPGQAQQTFYLAPISVDLSVLSFATIPGGVYEPALGNPASDGSLLSSTMAGVRSWLGTTAFGRALLGYASPSAFYAANPPPGPDVSTLAPLASPVLTGTPTAPTAAPGTNTTQLATTAFCAALVSASTHSTSSALLQRGRLASYRFDEGSGTLTYNDLAPATSTGDGALTLMPVGDGNYSAMWSATGLVTTGNIYGTIGKFATGSLPAAVSAPAFSLYWVGKSPTNAPSGLSGIVTGTGFAFSTQSGTPQFTFNGYTTSGALATTSDNTIHVWAAVFNGSTLRLDCDGFEVSSLAATPAAISVQGINIGASDNSGDYAFAGTYSDVDIYNVAHSPIQVAEQRLAYQGLLSAKGISYAPANKVIVIDGDSNFTGNGNATPWPNLAIPALTPTTQARSFAVAGSFVINGNNPAGNDLTTRAPMLKAAIAPVVGRPGARIIAVVESGTNDLGNVTAATLYAEMKTYCLDLIAHGVNRLILVTPLATTRTGSTGGPMQADINAYRTMVLADPTFYWAVVDTRADQLIGGDGAAGPVNSGAATTYFLDGTHLNNAGQVRWNALIQPVIQSALNS